MKRGDVVIVSTSGDYGKPRPAVLVQTNTISDAYPSIIACPITSTLVDLDFRISVEPTPSNALQLPSQIMTDTLIAVPRTKIGRKIGHLTEQDMQRLSGMLVFLLGLAETEGS